MCTKDNYKYTSKQWDKITLVINNDSSLLYDIDFWFIAVNIHVPFIFYLFRNNLELKKQYTCMHKPVIFLEYAISFFMKKKLDSKKIHMSLNCRKTLVNYINV